MIGTKVGRWTGRALVALSLALCSPLLPGQETHFQQQLRRFDLGLNGVGLFNRNSSGESYSNSNPRPPQAENLQLVPGNTFGGVFTLRYTKSPLIGAEFNYGYSRYTQKFNEPTPAAGQSCNFSSPPCSLQVQANTSEYTLGYVAHVPREFAFGVRPFGSVGLGSTEFKPTTFGGESLKAQARMTYYYAIGADAPIFTEHIALRLQFRQLFFLAPDFGQNYLLIKQHTSTLEPGIGFVFRF